MSLPKNQSQIDTSLINDFHDSLITCAGDWSSWLERQQEISLSVYQLKPAQLIADQRREQGISRDYKGREILELLQNGSDAAKKSGVRGHILIELTPSGLIVANTGVSFSTGGIKSLQTADLSPKRGNSSQLIGSKGLGFRSILNWSKHPIIISGELQLSFSSRYANSLIEKLKNQFRRGNKESKYNELDTINTSPILPFPVDLALDDLREYVEDDLLLHRCSDLKLEGFDTVIGMPFDRDDCYENAIEQLTILRSEFLLFTDSVQSLSVSVKGKGDGEYWSKKWVSDIISDDVVDLTELDIDSNTECCQRWQLFRESGDIPIDLLRDESDPDAYSLVVALKDEGLAEPANLYSFFPTSIPLPINALCHASLELEQNRKHLQEGDANKFVLERLGRFLANIFVQQANGSDNPFCALDLLNPTYLINGYQEDIHYLRSALVESLKSKKVFPVLSGKRLSASEALTLPLGVNKSDWLPKLIFPTILVSRNRDETTLFELLGGNVLDSDAFITLLNSEDEIDIEQRASIILGIIQHGLSGDYYYKGLLLDSDGNELSKNDRVYLPSNNLNEYLEFPEWSKVKILNKHLWKLIRGGNVRESAKSLSKFGVNEYALANIVSGLISSEKSIINDSNESEVHAELLIVMMGLFSLYHSNEDRPDFPKASNVHLLSKNGSWVCSNELYFSMGYLDTGLIVDELYKSVPQKLVASISVYTGMELKEEYLTDFFKWLGVAEWPRLIRSENIAPEFLTYTKQNISYPACFSNNDVHVFDSVEDLPSNLEVQSACSIDCLDDILKSESDAILAWLANDMRAVSWLRPGRDFVKFVFYPHRAVNARCYLGELPSYIYWCINNVKWLRGSENKLLSPSESLLNDAALSGLFPRPLEPSNQSKNKFKLTQSLLKHAWINAGVRERIDELTSEEIYKLLLELPRIDPDGELSKKLYNWLIKTTDFDFNYKGLNYISFGEKGKVFCRKGDVSDYFPVSEVYHIDIEGFPQELLKSLPIASLLKKRGADKVRRLFKVNVLDKESVNEKVIHYRAAACTEIANQHFQLAKKYIEIFRHKIFLKAPGVTQFERIELIVCDQVQCQITFNHKFIENILPDWAYSIDGNYLYVCCSNISKNDPYSPLLANSIGDAIASMFGLTDGDSFSKIYQCDEISRSELLGKMLGDDLDENLDKMLNDLITEANQPEISESILSMGAVPDSSLPIPSAIESPEQSTPAAAEETKPASDVWNIPAIIEVEAVDHIPEAASNRIGLRISGGGSGSSGSTNSCSLNSDGKAGEKLAMLFEIDQSRHPLYIGHIVGYEAIAADILSFSTSKNRDLFESGENRSADLIERVIEAKEKRSGGVVKLTVNEANTAAKWKDKFYVYRFKPEGRGYQLKSLCNPLSHSESVVSSIEISLDTARATQQFYVYDHGEP